MKIKFNGDSPVDIPGVDGVQPGQVVDLPAEVAESLLLAGHGFADDGTVVAPARPLWSRAGKPPADPPASSSESAAAGKES